MQERHNTELIYKLLITHYVQFILLMYVSLNYHIQLTNHKQDDGRE